jgi:hypothetical protein
MLQPDDARLRKSVGFALLFSLLYCWGFYFFLGDIGFYPGDEGYLWYGVWRVGAGEVPLRDFQAYDPGRYYWCHLLSFVCGDGMLGLRASTTVFQCFGLFCALLVARRFTRNLVELGLACLVLGLWMFPNHKLFDTSIAAMAVWFTVRMLERPSTGRYLAAGAFAGLAGFFGRNHALYIALGTGAVLCLSAWKMRGPGWWRRAGAWAAGGLLGYSPMWGMFLFVPGFFAAFWHSNELILEHGTNLPYPWLWPWRINWTREGFDQAAEVALALAYLLPPVLLPLGLWRALRTPSARIAERAPVLAAVLIGLFYVHHAAVRSYPQHLAESLPAVLLLAMGGLALLGPRLRWSGWGLLALVTILIGLEKNPPLAFWYSSKSTEPFERFETPAGEIVRLLPRNARRLTALSSFIETNVGADQNMFIAPNRPALYPLLGKTSPSWWIYFFWKATDEEQLDLIRELDEAKVNWVLLIDRPIDGREDMRFFGTHPAVAVFLMREFERVEMPGTPGNHILMKRLFPL